MDDALPQEFLSDPNAVPTETLKNHLRWVNTDNCDLRNPLGLRLRALPLCGDQRQFHIPNLEWMSRTETLAVFGRLAAPRPQRGGAGSTPNAAAESSAPAGLFRKVNVNRKRVGNEVAAAAQSNGADQSPKKPSNIERVTGECKRIRLDSGGENSPNGGGRKRISKDEAMETDAGGGEPEKRQRRAAITWP